MLRLVMRTARNSISAHVNFGRLLPLRWSVLKNLLNHIVKTLMKACRNLVNIVDVSNVPSPEENANAPLPLTNNVSKYPIIGVCDK